MAVITNYTTLQTAVSDYLARSDLTTFIPNFVQNWEEDFYREPKNWGSWMESSSLGLTISNGIATLPADYLGFKIAYITGQRSPPLKRISLDQLYQRYPRSGTNGQAVYFARNGQTMEFGPIPSGGTVSGTYYAKPATLRNDGDNWLTTNAPDLCLYGSLISAEPFLKNDARIGVWRELYGAALQSYRNQFTEEDYSGAPPHTVVV